MGRGQEKKRKLLVCASLLLTEWKLELHWPVSFFYGDEGILNIVIHQVLNVCRIVGRSPAELNRGAGCIFIQFYSNRFERQRRNRVGPVIHLPGEFDRNFARHL